VRWVHDRKPDERDARELESASLVFPGLGDGSLQGFEKVLRTFTGYFCEQRVLVAEMVIRSSWRHSGSASDVPQGEPGRTNLRECLEGRRNQRVSQIAVVVGLLAARGGSRPSRSRHQLPIL
jgi:hypothetical protein